MIEFPGEGIRARLRSSAVLGSIAGGSLFIGASPRRLLSSLTSTTPVSSDGYVAEVFEAIAIVGANTLVGPVLETILTSMLVVGVMYKAFDLAEIRETAPLYTTYQFQLLIAVLSGGFGIILIGLTPRSTLSLLVWAPVVMMSLFVFIYYKTDPASLGNPAVAIVAKVSGYDLEEYRYRLAHEDDFSVRYQVSALIFGAAAVFFLLTMTFGVVVLIATLLYPLPEVLVLVWVFAQVVGIGSLPIIGRVTYMSRENVGIEGRIFGELGSATSSIYTLVLALFYLIFLALSGGVFSAFLLALLYFLVIDPSSFWDGLTAGSTPATLYAVVAIVGTLFATGYFFLYWFLQLRRLPAVAELYLGDSNTTVKPQYRRIEGLTLPAAALIIWLLFSTQALYGGQSSTPITQWVGVAQWVGSLIVIFVLILSCGWTIYRLRWAGLDPQPVKNEKWVALVGGTVTIGLISFMFGLFTPTPIIKSVVLPISIFLLMGSILYYISDESIEELSEETPIGEDVLVWGSLVIGMLIASWVTPSLQFVFVIAIILLTSLTVFKRVYEDSSERGG